MDKQNILSSVAQYRKLRADADESQDLSELSPRLAAVSTALCAVVSGNGQFLKDESHYMASGPAGMTCGDCIFFNTGSCHLVAGPVDALATCRWNMPDPSPDDDEAAAAKMVKKPKKSALYAY